MATIAAIRRPADPARAAARRLARLRRRRAVHVAAYKVRWGVKRAADRVGPLALDAAGLGFLAAAGFVVAVWLGLVVAGLGCWVLNVRIDKRAREVRRS